MPAEVRKYVLTVYGGPSGFQNARADIVLFGEEQTLGVARFHDDGMPYPEDVRSQGVVFMHLPASMLQSVLDILRWEKPVYFEHAGGHARLTTSFEAVGEEEGGGIAGLRAEQG